MARWRASMPRYRTPVILYRHTDGPSSAIGNQRSGSNIARVLRAFESVSIANITLPSVAAPADHFVEPGDYDGWQAWWPPAPDNPPSPYRIPDPPVIERTRLPTAALPILWEAFAEVGSGSWQARISAVYVRVEWMPKTGKEAMAGMRELAMQEAALKVRPKLLATAGVKPISWQAERVDDGTHWKIEGLTPSFRRGEFTEILVERNGHEDP